MREWLEQALQPLPDLELRRMFGGVGVYSADAIIGILYEQRFYLKTNDSTRTAFVQRESEPLRARSGSVLTRYYEVPADILDDEQQLLGWARVALGVAEEAAAKPRRRGHVDPEEILSGHSAEIRTLAEQARAIVRERVPHASEAGYPGWRLIGYRAPHYFCFVAPQPDHVRVGFEYGVALPDPKGVLEPMGKQVRFVRLEPGKRIPKAALRALIEAAAQYTPPARKRAPRGAKTK